MSVGPSPPVRVTDRGTSLEPWRKLSLEPGIGQAGAELGRQVVPVLRQGSPPGTFLRIYRQGSQVAQPAAGVVEIVEHTHQDGTSRWGGPLFYGIAVGVQSARWGGCAAGGGVSAAPVGPSLAVG